MKIEVVFHKNNFYLVMDNGKYLPGALQYTLGYSNRINETIESLLKDRELQEAAVSLQT